VPLAGDLADPDMCRHLWPGGAPRAFGAVDALGDGLAAEDVAADDVPDRAAVEEVEALAMLSPSARVAPSTAPPAAVPTRGLLIPTRFSFRWYSAGQRPEAGRGDPCSAGPAPGAGRAARQVPVRQSGLTGRCALLLSPR